MYFDTSLHFRKRYKRLPKKIQIKFDERISIFEKDEFDPILKNHKLHGKYGEYRSINITSDIRLIYKKMPNGHYLLYEIGTHSELYS
jgi:addiction module RelE/StbE family toxin